MLPESAALFQKILETRSWHMIQHLIETKVQEYVLSNEDIAALQEIQALRSLDEIDIICHTRLVQMHVDAIQALKAFIAKKR